MRTLPLTLSNYIARHFLASIFLILGVVAGLVFLIDLMELIRRAGSRDTGFGLVLELAILKLPDTLQRVLPFAILIGSILALTRLTRTHELIVARASGVSAWQFLLPGMAVTLLLGLITIAVFNPIASAMLSRYERLEAVHLKGHTSLLAVSSSGLWLRQRDDNTPPDLASSVASKAEKDAPATDEESQDKSYETLIHALRVAQDQMRLYDVILFLFDPQARFIHRIDAPSATLKDGYWEINQPLITAPDKPAERRETYHLPTELTIGQIQESFSSPETLSLWELPSFIGTLEQAGFSALRHRLHLQAMLAMPLLLCAMVLLGSVFSLRPHRMGKTGLMISAGVATGFLIYFLSDLVHALGLSGVLPLPVAAWSPAFVVLLAGVALTLHYEDG